MIKASELKDMSIVQLTDFILKNTRLGGMDISALTTKLFVSGRPNYTCKLGCEEALLCLIFDNILGSMNRDQMDRFITIMNISNEFDKSEELMKSISIVSGIEGEKHVSSITFADGMLLRTMHKVDIKSRIIVVMVALGFIQGD